MGRREEKLQKLTLGPRSRTEPCCELSVPDGPEMHLNVSVATPAEPRGEKYSFRKVPVKYF